MTIAEKLTAIANKLVDVFNAGKKKQYDEFWDSYQNEGKRKDYRYAFYGEGWNIATLKPKHTIKPKDANYMFYLCGHDGALEESVLDLSGASTLIRCFEKAKFTELGTIDVSNAAAINNLFVNMPNLHTIKKFIIGDNWNITFDNIFTECTNLVNIEVQGILGGDVVFSDCHKLSKESITSIINALDTRDGWVLSLSEDAVTNAFTETEWNELIGTRGLWEITLE